ncbi:TIGR04283 family arsenosugar biosynthesis glycosyltransferase [Lacinutrix sp. C3R15]|uniref:TIGR04283 family arsenosugar biosynthesis glycosyltransferase n=1 Tax=Flavobacteriaceae TaxID=49546 RepID=UPI001C08AC00|nr:MULTISPECIES: TIGR04283 family arsenosugar biosynthesis glycosyltransferase [Flavobacteriaceae]MBU2939147.1 TIGR04283 family arsenosugar biosynthesis glycosyltransferase [Lacinutrix sp. C3R15]MDO6622463.1 TIGR04283 family arsenosugar biosynthesis glycosyltransferase [Oceanihabitans sp. 1_MG-2023]
MKNSISIIIPMLNEAENIEKLLLHLTNNASLQNLKEIIVVDGGSTDGSQEIVTNLDLKIHLLHAKKGRAKQMNIGAKAASGSILYFLHADSFPPKNFDQLILNEVKKKHLAGCFRLQFNSSHWWLQLASWFTKFNWKACRGGDQSQFITKALFYEIGGFNEDYIIYEDYILISELYKRNQFVVINKKIKTSARLYEKHGVWKLQYHFWAIYIKKWLGASPDSLHAYYKKHIY